MGKYVNYYLLKEQKQNNKEVLWSVKDVVCGKPGNKAFIPLQEAASITVLPGNTIEKLYPNKIFFKKAATTATKRNRITGVENKFMFTRGCGGRGSNK